MLKTIFIFQTWIPNIGRYVYFLSRANKKKLVKFMNTLVFKISRIFYQIFTFGGGGGNSEFNGVWIWTSGWTHSSGVVGSGRWDGGWGHHDGPPLASSGRNRCDELVMVVHWLVITVISRSHMMNRWTVFLKKTKKYEGLYIYCHILWM